jgi:anthranilate synthase component 1
VPRMIAFEQFEQLAAQYNVIPLERTMLADLLTPVSTYLTLRRQYSSSFLFESVEPDEKIGRFSFVGTEPRVLVRCRGGTARVFRDGESSEEYVDPFELLRSLAEQYRAPQESRTTFTGGFVGFIGYDSVKYIERLALSEPRSGEVDDAMFGLFDTIVRFDHRAQRVTVFCTVIVDHSLPLRSQYDAGKQRLDAIELRLRSTPVSTNSFHASEIAETDDDKARFCGSVEKAKQHIVEGDIFQVVLSRRRRFRFVGDSFILYRALRIINPSPYLFYLDFGETKLIGSSPEVLVRSISGSVELFPIAGTRGRGKSEEEDKILETELVNDEKENAEHLMLVDLGRNDVGRVSEHGSVHVPVFKRVERYSHVMHLVSEVKGKLQKGKSAIDVLKACFPAGTVSGAPKVRAMEIIQDLEGTRRGVYAGAVGYIGFNDTMDMCIAIRTIVAHEDTLTVQAGAGIVANSVPEREYEETEEKMGALIQALELSSRGLRL